MGFVPKLIFLWFYDFCENAKLHSSSWPGLGIQINCSWTGPRSENLLHVRSGSGPQFGSGSGSEPFYAVELSILNNFEIYSFTQVFHLKNILFKNYTKSMALFSLFNLCGSGSVHYSEYSPETGSTKLLKTNTTTVRFRVFENIFFFSILQFAMILILLSTHTVYTFFRLTFISFLNFFVL